MQQTHTGAHTPRAPAPGLLSQSSLGVATGAGQDSEPSARRVWEPAPAVKAPLFSLLCKRCSDYHMFSGVRRGREDVSYEMVFVKSQWKRP